MMKTAILILAMLTLAVAHGRKDRRRNSNEFGNYVAVANRNGGSISLVNPKTLEPVNYKLPNNGEPMYFVCLFRRFDNHPLELWVGDRKNNRLVILQLKGKRIINDGYLRTPKGLFHSMATQRFEEKRPLAFSTCDIDNVTIVHDVRARKKLCLMHRPKNVARLGAKPHDVTANRKYAFVSYIGASDGNGYVASYVARTCRLVSVIKTVKDPHLAVRSGLSKLFIAAQGGEVLTRSIPKLKPRSRVRAPNPHGIVINCRSKFVYVTNIADGGKNAVFVFKPNGRRVAWCPQIDTSFPTPHNPMVAYDDKTLYITHTIAGKSVCSSWAINRCTGCVKPGTEKIFRTGDTPFGISVIPPDRFCRY